MISHRHVTEFLPDLTASQLNGYRKLQVKWHLRRCAACRIELEEFRRVDALLSAEFEERMSAELISQEVFGRIRTSIHDLPDALGRRRHTLVMGLAVATAGSVAVLLIWVFFLATGNQLSPRVRLPAQGQFTVIDGDSVAGTGDFTFAREDNWSQSLQLDPSIESVSTRSIRFSSSAIPVVSDENSDSPLKYITTSTDYEDGYLLTAQFVLDLVRTASLVADGKTTYDGRVLDAYDVSSESLPSGVRVRLLRDKERAVAIVVSFTNGLGRSASITMNLEE